jgi:urea transport system substrate-binding protein
MVASPASPAIVRAAGEAPIKVGLISPLTGVWTGYGRAHSAGFRLAVDEINAAGGVLGRKVEVLIRDSKTEPRIVVEQANRLVREERVDFLAGTFSSAERNAVGPVITAAKKVLLYPSFYEGQAQKYYPGVCNKDIFMFGPEPTQQVWPHMEYMMDEFGTKFFMIGSDAVWPRITNEFAKKRLKELDGRVAAEVYIPLNAPQYDSVLRQIRDSKANVIFHTLTGSDAVKFRKQFASSGMNKDFILWSVNDEEVVISGLGPDMSAGTYVSFDYFMSIDAPNNGPFLDRFRAKFGKDALMNTVGVAMYNAAHMAALALTKSGKVSTEALREGLGNLSFDKAPQGRVMMRGRDNQMVLPSYLMRVRRGWTGVDDMFKEIQRLDSITPVDARCKKLPL